MGEPLNLSDEEDFPREDQALVSQLDSEAGLQISYASSQPPTQQHRSPALLVAAACTLALLFFASVFVSKHTSVPSTRHLTLVAQGAPGSMPEPEPGLGQWFDGCQHVYLDVGSNVGIQMRKVFEPELYPDAKVLPLFNKHFGPERRGRTDLCVVGFEPNPAHTERLRALEAAYVKKGWRIKIFTEAAASLTDGFADFYLDKASAPNRNEWGASLVAWQKGMKRDGSAKAHVRTLDLGRYIMQNIATRKLADPSAPSVVLMKLDIEGSEHLLLPHLIVTGALCHVNVAMAEYHGWGFVTLQGSINDPAMVRAMMDFVKRYDATACPTELVQLDDESYGMSNLPLPQLLRRMLRSGGE